MLFSCVGLSATPWTAVHQASLSFTISWNLFKFMSFELVMPSNNFILCHPLLFPPSIFSSIWVFFSELALHIRWSKYCSFSYIKTSDEYSGLISFRIDWFDLLAVPWSFLQHHSSKASILERSAFFMVRFSHPFMTTEKTIALTRRTFVGKTMSLLFNMLSRLVTPFLPRTSIF